MNKTISLLRTVLIANVGVAVVIAALYELDILPPGMLAGRPQDEFLSTISMELITIVFIPVALRLFKTKDVEKRLEEGNIKAFRKWGLVRILMITVPLVLNTLLYYSFMNTTFGYMALILLICLPFIYPASRK
ncbi:MAG: hypothetical protein PUI49_06605 [Prevotellaceae bacterium]|nr:hypothetical protein [Prevotellaceae bacterium]MDY5210487.1 hypothetical protein [Prevotella sp.]